MEDNFTPEQQRYLEGLVAGMTAARMTGGIPTLPAEPSGPDAPHRLAMARAEAAGRKLADQERFKKKWSTVEALVGSDKRLALVAKDMVAHVPRERFGKARELTA